MNHNEYFKECLSNATAAILLFEVDSAEVVFVNLQEKNEYFNQDTWILIPDGINGMCGSFTNSDIDNATIVYDKDADEFHVAFVNQDEMFDAGFEHFKRIQFLYTKKVLN
jgi:hypothetical protein